MYFTKDNNFPHGIMFHQFHDGKFFKAGEGSISKDDFSNLINFIGKKNILDAELFFQKKMENKLKEYEVCLTFDDGLKCQLEVALKVLEDFNIKAFFFVSTSNFENKPDFFEITKYFKLNYFNNSEEFYDLFFKILDKDYNNFLIENKTIIKEKIRTYPFYTKRDIEFRLIRDRFLSEKDYIKIISSMFVEKNYKVNEVVPKLFFSKSNLLELDGLGHTIGLHSHSHTKYIEHLSHESQKIEYSKNQKNLSKILSKPNEQINSMSHPLGSYNETSLEILKSLKVLLGFRDNMFVNNKMKNINNSNLEIAREDHALIMKKMKI